MRRILTPVVVVVGGGGGGGPGITVVSCVAGAAHVAGIGAGVADSADVEIADEAVAWW